MKNIILISLLLLVSSCNRQDINIFVLPEETPIKGSDYLNEMIMTLPLGIDIIDDKLLIFMHKDEHVIRIVDANTGAEINQTGIFGNGPGEFIQPVYCGFNKNKDIYIYNEGQKNLRKYTWEEIIKTPVLPKLEGIPLKNGETLIISGRMLNNENLIGSVAVGTSKPIAIFDKGLNIRENIGNVPDKAHQSKALVSYWGSISTFDNKFVFAMASLGYIACYEQDQDGISKMLWDSYAEKPHYKGDQLDLKHLMLGFTDVKMTKNYIFCSYFGQKFVFDNRRNIKVRNILVFDHSGKLLKNFYSDRSVAKITVSEDENTLYAITEEPEVAIIKFDISKLIK